MTTNNQAIAVSGIHHITAVSASAADNFEFYTGVLGLQLVKKTVNFDDPTTYHLYYGDQAGQPGTIMTFFPWEQLSRGKPGAGMVSAIAFAVSRPSMGYWRQRLADNRVAVDETVRFDEPVLRFNDPHGLPLELVGTQPSTGGDGTDIAIRGFHSATLLLNHLPATRTIIGDCLGMRFEGNQGRRYRFSMPDRQSPGHLLG